MSGLNEYIVTADGRIAGVARKKGDCVELSKYAAKYENVTLKPDLEPRDKKDGAGDDQPEKSSDQAKPAESKAKQEGRAKK